MTSILSFGWKSKPNKTTLSATPCVRVCVRVCVWRVGGYRVTVKVMLGQLYRSVVGGDWFICDDVWRERKAVLWKMRQLDVMGK